MWYQDMLDNGVSQEIAGVLADLYTPKIAKLGKPPKIKPINGRGHFNMWTNMIEYDPNNGHVIDTLYHEFGHWHDYHTRFKNHRSIMSWGQIDAIGKEFNDICNLDWNNLKKTKGKQFASKLKAFDYYVDIQKKYPSWSTGDYFSELAERLFKKEYNSLDSRERYIVLQYKDTIGSITNGKYGGGHSKEEYRDSWANEEAYANAFAAWARKDSVFALDFPEIWKYINDKMK